MDDVHVMPVNDLKEHEESRFCACRPVLEKPVEGGGTVVIHNSYDGREITERAVDQAFGHGKN